VRLMWSSSFASLLRGFLVSAKRSPGSSRTHQHRTRPSFLPGSVGASVTSPLSPICPCRLGSFQSVAARIRRPISCPGRLRRWSWSKEGLVAAQWQAGFHSAGTGLVIRARGTRFGAMVHGAMSPRRLQGSEVPVRPRIHSYGAIWPGAVAAVYRELSLAAYRVTSHVEPGAGPLFAALPPQVMGPASI